MQFQLPNGQTFDTENPCCPNCGGEMWDNRNNKKNPKQPDFRCKDTACKNENGYQTGVYLPKQGKGGSKAPAKAAPAASKPAAPAITPAAKPTAPAPKPVGSRGDYGNTVPPSMYGAWAMNLVVSLVGQGKVTSVSEGIAAYKEALQGVGQAIEENKIILDAKTPIPPAQQERQVAKPAAAPVEPVQQAAAPSEALPDPLQQIEQDLSGGVDEISAEDLSNLDL